MLSSILGLQAEGDEIRDEGRQGLTERITGAPPSSVIMGREHLKQGVETAAQPSEVCLPINETCLSISTYLT